MIARCLDRSKESEIASVGHLSTHETRDRYDDKMSNQADPMKPAPP